MTLVVKWLGGFTQKVILVVLLCTFYTIISLCLLWKKDADLEQHEETIFIHRCIVLFL